MKISVMTFPYHRMLSAGKESIDSFLSCIMSVGASGIEPMLEWKEKEPECWDYLCQAAHARGLEMAAYDIGINLVTSDAEEFCKTSEKVKRQIVFCREQMNCGVALFYYNRPVPGIALSESRKRYGEMLNVISEYAEKYDVNVCFENFDPLPEFVCSSAACLEVLSYAPKAGFSFDIGNALIVDENGRDILPVLKGRIKHIHAKDKKQAENNQANTQRSLAGKHYVDAILGEGDANVASCIKYMADNGYNSWITIESFAGYDNLPKEISFLKNII